MFQEVVEAYQRRDRSRPFLENENALSDTENEFPTDNLHCEAEHVDGSMNATTKESKINWLKANTSENVCRILSNVRCLSEGVDVPALDAVLFLTPRNSQVDVVQSVGRVMRNAPGKKRGYVILPVVIPAGIKRSSAQITTHYTKEELVGKQIVAVVNFPPKQIANFFSECLVLGAIQTDGSVILLQTDLRLDRNFQVNLK